MLEILRAGWRELSGNPRRTLALSLGPVLLLLVAAVLDVFFRRPGWPLDWSALAYLPAAGWLSVNWLSARAVDEPAPAAMPAMAIRPLLRSMWLCLLVFFMAALVAVPAGAVRLYLLSQTDLMTQSLRPMIVLNLAAGLAMVSITIWLWLRLAPAFAAAATGTSHPMRVAFAATRSQATAILGLALAAGIVLLIANQASTLAGSQIAAVLRPVSTGLSLLATVVLCRVIAGRTGTPTRAEIFA